MKQELINKLQTFLKENDMKGISATQQQIEEAEKVLNVKFSDEISFYYPL